MGDPKEYGVWIGGILAGITALSLGFRRAVRMWEGEGRDITRIKAETSVVDLLHTELVRVVDQNKTLALEIAKLHDLVNQVRTENAKLTASVTRLTYQLEEIERAKHTV